MYLFLYAIFETIFLGGPSGAEYYETYELGNLKKKKKKKESVSSAKEPTIVFGLEGTSATFKAP